MIRFISCGQEDKAIEVFNHLYQVNMTNNTTTEKGVQNFVFNVNLSIMRLMSPKSGIDVMEKVNFEEAITLLHDITERNIEMVSEWCRQKWVTKSARMENLLNYVDANLTESMLSLDMVANYFGVSPSLVSRLFAEQHGERFHDYVNKQRIQKSLDMLLSNESKTDISKIAAQVGYTSGATFRRLFKKYMSVSPSEYRTNMLKI